MTDLIRDARTRLGLSIYDLAARLGVTAGAVSQLEQSERAGTIKVASLRRALDVMGERLSVVSTPSTMAARNLLSARSAARAIDHELATGDPDAALRLTIQAIDHFRQAENDNEVADFLKKPATLSDQRWDTLLATAVAWEASRRGVEAPRWTRKPPLDDEWIPSGFDEYSPEYVEFVRRSSEPAFLSRRILMREKDLMTR